jgi:hypothetical protein
MALPPIITNSPLFRVFTGSPTQVANEQPRAAKSGAPEDKVTLSGDALKKLDDLESAESAREAAGNIRVALQNNPDVKLGLAEDAAF